MRQVMNAGAIRAAALACALALAAPALGAGEFEAGLAAYDAGDPARARVLWTPLAQAGHTDAQNNLGWLYESGEGGEKDLQRALYWYRKAAASDPQWLGNMERVQAAIANAAPAPSPAPPPAPPSAGSFDDGLRAYDAGDGARAARIWQPLAEAGSVDAQNNLGWLYENGEGVGKDLAEARRWYAAAAAQDPQWTGNLERVEAAMAAERKAAAPVPAPAAPSAPVGGTFEDGLAAYDGGDPLRAARIWLPHAEAGNVDAQNNLGWIYEHGEGVARDLGEALRWYRAAARANPEWATNRDRVAAAIAAERRQAPAAGDASGEERFAEAMRYFESGSDLQAAALLEPLAAGGHARAMTNLGYLYETGRGVTRDERRARDLYLAAAGLGEVHAQNNLAVLLASGRGGQIDLVGAYVWFDIAARGGHGQAGSNRDALEPLLSAGERAEAARLVRARASGG